MSKKYLVLRMKRNLGRKFLILAITQLPLLALSACGVQSEVSSPKISSETAAGSNVGTNGQLVSIQSDNVSFAGYDEISRVMTVQFKNGALYEYYGVSADLWTSFIAAQPHPWSQVGYPRLVNGGIPYKRIG